MSTALNVSVAASSDDAQQVSGGATNITATALNLISTGSPRYIGLLFALPIPLGAIILTAIIRFTAQFNVSSNTSTWEISCQAADNAATFAATSNNISGRTRTTAVTSYPAPATTANATSDTPDFAPSVQEVVSRAGWVNGNNLAVILRLPSDGAGSTVAMFSFDNGSNVPQLRLTYSPPRFLPEQLGLQSLRGLY